MILINKFYFGWVPTYLVKCFLMDITYHFSVFKSFQMKKEAFQLL